MQANSIRRIVILSATGIGDSFADALWLIRFLIRRSNVGIAYADHDRVDSYIRTTDTDWTLARAVGVSDSEKEKRLIVSYANEPKPVLMISRRQVAKFLIDSLGDQRFFGKSPVISEQ